ncbi:hypothetical protein [Clostridium botulinum]|uniref:hypothetical protein n=1 Tax=Clostridium botulinum TaxID=1491 RepID=UPI0002075151|nr:hypothetical protein [Clostridium botulinum]AEB76476.1 conserved hypothetical protein [Clostridium botulinum BKT015925]MCD3197533.1 hypothetical protein [Clostridium botulinum C/D]MCD3201998.1 hypothetical protein [Clostridium botulinum C/D]MCD3212032.1 hypothetical protein [Clostridium botulinum C/D]MCD3214265.1 hypothetical protein [Clostridium botulinum C/D]
MGKKLKSETNNQWTSLSENSCKDSCCCNKKHKTATDNQWTSTIKNNVTNCNNTHIEEK